MKLYEDGVCTAELVMDGAALGHIKVVPKQSAMFLSELPQDVCVQLFYVASFAATGVFEGLGAQGTNILVREGDSLSVDVLPRAMNDGIDLLWEPKRAEQAELEQVASKVKDELWYVGQEDAAPAATAAPQPGAAPPPPPKTDVAPEDNYKLRQLKRKL